MVVKISGGMNYVGAYWIFFSVAREEASDELVWSIFEKNSTLSHPMKTVKKK